MRKKGLAYFMTATMMLSMLLGVPATSLKAEAATFGGYTVTGDTSKCSYADGKLTINDGANVTISVTDKSSGTTDTIYVSQNASATLTLKECNIYNYTGIPAIEIADNSTGTVKILLDGKNNIDCCGAAIQKNGTDGNLIIDDVDDDDTDSDCLIAIIYPDDALVGCAVIGGGAGKDTGNITINGGEIWGISTSTGAVIGGGSNASCDGITINGGTIYAAIKPPFTDNNIQVAREVGAAIGGGSNGDGNNITITGGTITTRMLEINPSTDYGIFLDYIKPFQLKTSDTIMHGGAGIGGGYNGDGNNITISGGTIYAEGDDDSADIGAGKYGNATGIVISGGYIEAVSGGYYKAGIGAGAAPLEGLEKVVDITISGGTIVAKGGGEGPAIGAGYKGSAKVIITGGSIHAIPGTDGYKGLDGLTYYADAIGLGAYSNGCDHKDSYDRYVVASADEIVEGEDTVTLQEVPYKGAANTNMKNKLAFTYKDGTEYAYNTNGMVTDDEGYIYAWVKNGVEISEKISDGELNVLFNGAAKKDWYGGTVRVTADGYTVSGDNSAFATYYDITTSGTHTLYFKGASGKVTDISVTVNIDTTAPTGRIQLEKGKKYITTINEDTTVKKIKFTDPNMYINQVKDTDGSGVASVEYALSSKCYASEDAIKKATDLSWIMGDMSNGYIHLPITAGKNQAVYVKMTDKVGNVSYISTPIYCYDTTGPEITYTLSGVTATSLDYNITFSEECEYIWVLLKSGSSASSWSAIESLINKGNPGGVLTGSTATQTSGTIENLLPNTSYKMYVIARESVETIDGTSTSNSTYDGYGNYVKTLKKTKTLSNQTEYIKVGSGTSFTYDLREMFGLDVADMGTVSYSCSKGVGSILASDPVIDANGNMTVQLNSGLTANASQDITISITSTYYYDMSATLTIETTDKTTLSLSGVSVEENATYDGTQKSYNGNVKWTDGNGNDCTGQVSTSIRYVGVDNNYSDTAAPTDAGSYQVVFTVQDNDNYKGSRTYSFTIAPMNIASEMSDMAWYLDDNTRISGTTLNITEDGKMHTVGVKGVSSKVTPKTIGTFSAKGAGNYTATVNFEYSGNYTLPSYLTSTTLNWSIVAQQSDDDDDNNNNGGSTGGESGGSTGGEGGSTEGGNGGSTGGENGGSTGGENGGSTGGDNGSLAGGEGESILAVGTTEKIGSDNYKVTTSSIDGGTVEYIAPVNKSATKKVVIPATVTINNRTYKVTSIAKNAFSGCKKLTSVTIPNGVVTIGANAFKKCTSLKTVKIPNSVTSIGANAFNGCKKLTKATIGNGVKTIGNGAFSGCSKLKTVSIKASCKLTKIGDKAFYKCTSLTKITLPKNFTTLGKQAFFGCKKLKTITIKSKKLKNVGTKAIKGIHKNATIKCPSKSYVAKYKKLFKSKTGYTKTMKIK